MKTNMKLKLAATAAAVLATGLLSQSAKANSGTATLTELTLGSEYGETFVLRSSEMQVGPNDYFYQYDFGVSTDPAKPGPNVPLSGLTVLFDTLDTTPTGASGVNVHTGNNASIQTTTSVTGEINWSFNTTLDNGSTEEIMSFTSPDGPGLGQAAALNGGSWLETSGTVVVPVPPSVPDTATTLSLLGGAIVGLGALRRKIGC
jgi:hypothetical protein